MPGSSITIEGIDQTIEALGYRPGSAKQKAIAAIRKHYTSDESVNDLSRIDSDILIQSIWNTGSSLSKIKSKRRNFSSLRSSINSDLKKLLKKNQNPENLILSDNNIFDLTQEAKDNLLGSFADAFKKGEVDLDQAATLLETMTEFLEDYESKEKEPDSQAFTEKIKTLLDKMSRTILSGSDEGEAFGKRSEGGEETFETEEALEDFDDLAEDEVLEEVDEIDDDEDIEEIEVEEDEDLEAGEYDDGDEEDIEEVELDEDEEFETVDEDDEDGQEEDIEEVELDEDEELEELDDLMPEDVEELDEVDDLITDDVEEIDEDVEELDETDDDDDFEEIEIDEDIDFEDDEILDEDAADVELDEDQDIETVELDDDEEIEEVDVEDDDSFEEIDEVDEEDELGEDEDLEAVELGDDEDIEEIELDEDEELEEIDELDEDELKALEEFREKRELAEQFDIILSEKERKFNKYGKVPQGLYTVGTLKSLKSTLELQQFDMPEVYIALYPVTNSLFEIFIEETGYVTTAEKKGFGRVYTSRFKKNKDRLDWNRNAGAEDVKGACWYQPSGPESSLYGKKNHPVVQVSVDDAITFSSWIGRRLPTETEWEAAARTDLGNKYPWGNSFDPGAVNLELSGFSDTCPVDEFDGFANGFDIVDMLGNVMEWTADMEIPDFKSSKNVNYCIAKGGAWNSSKETTISSRALFRSGFTSNTIGFRCISEILL